MILIALIACVIFSTGSLAWGYWLAGYEGIARWVFVFGVLWLLAQWRKWKWFTSPAVLVYLLLAGYGVWFKFIPGWMFSGSVFGLFAWDLAEFQKRIKNMPAREDIHGMTRRRILRISLLVLLGFMLVSLVMLVNQQFARDWGLFVLFVCLIGSLQAFAWRIR